MYTLVSTDSVQIKDSGDRRQFESGAVRDISEDKGRCDLLPLDTISHLLQDRYDCDTSEFLESISNFIYTGDIEDIQTAIDSFCMERNWDIYTAILEVSIHYEQGARKYTERNWEKGIPLHSYLDSAIRHYLKWRREDNDEPHDRAVIWNLLGAMWTYEHKPQFIDLPFAKSNVSEVQGDD